MTIEAGYDIAGADPRAVCGRNGVVVVGHTAVDAADYRAFLVRQVERLAQTLGDRGRAQTQITAFHVTLYPQLGDDRLGQVYRYREAQVLRSLENQSVNTDNLPSDVKQWAAAVAGIDSSVGLDEVPERGISCPESSAYSADHAYGNRVRKSGGVANGHRPLSRPDVVAIAQDRHRQPTAGLDFQQREIGLPVASDHGGVVIAIIQDGH